jgi:hypothetical protein
MPGAWQPSRAGSAMAAIGKASVRRVRPDSGMSVQALACLHSGHGNLSDVVC